MIRLVSLLNWSTGGSNGNNCWFEPINILNPATIARHDILRFEDTATKDTIYGSFTVPEDYVSSSPAVAPKIVVEWGANATTGNAVWDFDYRAMGGDGTEATNDATWQESATVTDAIAGTAWRRMVAEIPLTAANLAPGDVVFFALSRDGASSDTVAAQIQVYAAYFEYSDI